MRFVIIIYTDISTHMQNLSMQSYNTNDLPSFQIYAEDG